MPKQDRVANPVSQNAAIKRDEKAPSFMVPLFKLPADGLPNPRLEMGLKL
jgi:hypothetical protein